MTTVSAARREWAEGDRRFVGEARDPSRADALHAQRDAVLEELRRRLGPTFTLAELRMPTPVPSGGSGGGRGARAVPGLGATVSLAGDAAFHAYSRQAQDYMP